MNRLEALDFIIKNHHLKPTWLLYGPKGVGKLELSLTAASHIISTCDDRPLELLKKLMTQGSYPNFKMLQSKEGSDITTQEIKDLLASLKSYPLVEGPRVIVIDALDYLNRFGANALLKTLEEPPSNTIFFLLAHSLFKVLPTIRSRCTLLTITGALEHDLKADYPNASQEQLYLSQGRSMRLEKLFEEGAQENINLLREFFNQALLKNHAKIKETIDILKKRDIALEECIEVLSLWLRQDVSKKSSERYEALMAFFEIAQNAHLDKGQSYLALFLLLGDPSKKYCLS